MIQVFSPQSYFHQYNTFLRCIPIIITGTLRSNFLLHKKRATSIFEITPFLKRYIGCLSSLISSYFFLFFLRIWHAGCPASTRMIFEFSVELIVSETSAACFDRMRKLTRSRHPNINSSPYFFKLKTPPETSFTVYGKIHCSCRLAIAIP